MMKKNRKAVIAAILILVIAIGVLVICTAGRKKPAVSSSSVQMTVFNEGLTKAVRDDDYRTTYQIFVYSFCDSNGDGIGDLNGIRSKLDYIQDLGFDQIWLTPIHPSPTYHKYDVCDYCGIDPEFGTLEDFDKLVDECHSRGIRLIIDMVVNHSSSEHEWFKNAVAYLHELPSDWEPDVSYCKYFDYYNFSRQPQDGYAPVEGTNWYYEARFWSGMPDFNLDSQYVRDEITDILNFWISRGVDGFRLDAVTSYKTGDPVGSTEFMRWFCDTARSIDPDCYIVGEAWTDRASIAQLYSSGIDSLFNFPFAGAEGIICNTLRGSISASDFVHAMIASDETYRAANPDYIDAPFYTNHDMARSAGYYALDDGPQTKMAYAMNFMMSGNAFMYYGEELGMKGSGKDENKRAPMYWSDDPEDPDLCAGPPDMDNFAMKFPSLKDQQQDPLSLWNWFREVIKVRNAFPVIARGHVEAASFSDDHIAAFYKTCSGEQTVLIVMNLGDQEASCDLASEGRDLALSAVLNTSSEKISLNGTDLTLPAYSIAVLTEKQG